MSKKKKLPNWLLMLRKVRRQIQIELDIPKEYGKIHETSKKDVASRLRNSIRVQDIGKDI